MCFWRNDKSMLVTHDSSLRVLLHNAWLSPLFMSQFLLQIQLAPRPVGPETRQCFQCDLENGNNMAAPNPSHFSPSTVYHIVTWETELKGRRKVVGIFQFKKDILKKKECTVECFYYHVLIVRCCDLCFCYHCTYSSKHCSTGK